jgi:hypothetical protein
MIKELDCWAGAVVDPSRIPAAAAKILVLTFERFSCVIADTFSSAHATIQNNFQLA